jgi:DNA recombination protein Rad52
MKDNLTAATEKFDAPSADEVRKRLDEKIPRSAVALRDGGGPKKLSYLEGWYVIARLNEVLGQGNWDYNTEEMKLVHSGETNGKQTVHYIAKVCLTVHGLRSNNGYGITFSDYGYGDGSDKCNIGKAHELAVKEAVTDGLKRCAKNLGMSLGLALYDKTQENVDDGKEDESQGAGSGKVVAAAAMGPVRQGSAETVSPAPTQSALGDAPKDRGELNEKIGKMATIATKKNKSVTMGSLKTLLAETYKVSKKEELTDEQAKAFHDYLKGIIG